MMHDEVTPPEGPRDPLISTEEVAALTGLSVGTLVCYRHRGKGPPYVKARGARIGYRRDEVLDWLGDQPRETADLIDTAEAARIVGYSENHLQNLRCYGAGPPFVKMKGQRGRTSVYYRREDVIAWGAKR